MHNRNDIFEGMGEATLELDSPSHHDMFDDYTGPDNPNSVEVIFNMSPDIWDKVVVEGDEGKTVIAESADTFTVEYANSAAFTDALARFDGAVEYHVVANATDNHPIEADEFSEFANFGDVCRNRLGMQCQYGSRYVNPDFSAESAKEAGHFVPYLGEGLRIKGKPDNYHSLEIHTDDVDEFVSRVARHKLQCGAWASGDERIPEGVRTEYEFIKEAAKEVIDDGRGYLRP